MHTAYCRNVKIFLFFYLGKKPYGYKSKYEKKPKEDQDWEEPKEETHEDGDWKDDTDEDWEE